MSQPVSDWGLAVWLRRFLRQFAVRPDMPKMESQVFPVEPFDERRLLDLHNAERFRNFVPPLDVDPALTAIVIDRAVAAARRLIELERLHDGFAAAVARIAEPDPYPAAGRSFGENAAMGSATHESAMKTWMDSHEHRSNILTPGFKHMGAARGISAYGVTYWYVMFSS